VFITVTVCAPLDAPTPVVGKFSSAGCTCAAPPAPLVPVRATVAEFVAGELTVNTPVTPPLAVGVNTISTEQLAFAESDVPHVFCVRLKGGVTMTVKPLALALLVFVTVTVCAALD
jgi:hypothetical protein